MTQTELHSMTVLQLRKMARTNNIILGAGVDKSAIIDKIIAGLREAGQEVEMDMVSSAPAGDESSSAPQAGESASAASPAESAGKAEGGDMMREPFVSPLADAGESNESASPVPAPAASAPQSRPATAAESSEPKFQAAWHRPEPAQFNGAHPAGQSSGFGGNRSAWQSTTPSGRPFTPEQRVQPSWPNSSAPRFGPGTSLRRETPAVPQSESSAPAPRAVHSPLPDHRVGFQGESPAPAHRPVHSPLPDHRIGFIGGGGFGPRASANYSPAPAPASMPDAPEVVSAVSAPAASPSVPDAPEVSPIQTDAELKETPAEGAASAAPADEAGQAEKSQQEPSQEGSSISPSLEELLASGEFEEGGGILELHPDGYGFLRASHFLPSTKDIYVSMAQIRRFNLRTGDDIRGKIRPRREGDKYGALLYIDTVNGIPEESAFNRPAFDELTPIYPERRISLEFKDKPSIPAMRVIDLIAPLGFGQRGLLLCPPETEKYELLQDYARVITENYPDVEVLMLLIDLNPEDVTLIRDRVPCQVLASTFDQAPEAHLRLAEMVLERSMRLVEQKKDVVILADSLTRLAKIYTTSAVQQGRSLPGMVNPASLLRAKKLFGAARACREGGSLTVIAAMDIATGSRVDDSVVEEFKGTANMELMLDKSVAKAGVSPAINLSRSFTKNSDILLDDRQKEGLSLIRQLLSTTTSAVAISQLLSMMEKAGTNQDLLLKMKDWFALMNR